MKLSLGFSPCPNDTFIFDALVNNKIDTQGLHLNVVLEDVQTLNQWALEGKLDITKLSYGVLPLVLNNYAVLNSGSALGNGVGPLLIKNKNLQITDVDSHLIALPGENTTAHLLFSLAYPLAKNKIFLRYDAIENFVVQNKGLGVIIHENRFTYEAKNLEKIMDLGNFWETKTNNPIPLGGIVIKRNIPHSLQQKIDSLLKKSIEYAFANYPQLSNYIRKHSQELSEAVMRHHIDLYVNNFSINLDTAGKAAIIKLLQIYNATYPISLDEKNIFV